jgi:hypothetical protein
MTTDRNVYGYTVCLVVRKEDRERADWLLVEDVKKEMAAESLRYRAELEKKRVGPVEWTEWKEFMPLDEWDAQEFRDKWVCYGHVQILGDAE